METCLPDSNKTEDSQHTTTKVIARMKGTRKIPVKMKTTTIAPAKITPTKATVKISPIKPTVNATPTKATGKKSPTKEPFTALKTIIKTTPMTTLDRFKKLQMILLRGDLKPEMRQKITKLLMRLKFVLQKKGVVNANATLIKRRSDKRQGRLGVHYTRRV